MIYIFFAPGFEEIEAVTPLDVLRRAELDVQSVGVGAKIIEGAHGITTTCDLIADGAATDGLEMIVLPGGMPGTLNLEQSPAVQGFIDYAAEHDIPIAAICAAPSILGHRGLLDGRRATCFPGFEDQLGGAVNTGERVVQDGKLITAKGAGAALPFALKLVEYLCGKDRADLLEKSLQ